MDRQMFISGGALALLAAPLAGEAQQAGKVPRIALVFGNVPEADMLGIAPGQRWR